MSFRARVKSGRLVVDEPVNLPEGMVLDLVIDDEEDDLSDDERVVLGCGSDRAQNFDLIRFV